MNDKPTVKSTQKGGFVQGLPIPVAQPANTGGCCGGGTGDCCGGSSSGGGGCCGESDSDVNTSTNSSCSC